LDSNIECAVAEMCKENPELDGDGFPKLLPKDGGNRRVDSEQTWFYLKFSTLMFLIQIFVHF